MVIMAVDDDVIMESPYGAVVAMESSSAMAEFNKRNNLTLTITELDRGICASSNPPVNLIASSRILDATRT